MNKKTIYIDPKTRKMLDELCAGGVKASPLICHLIAEHHKKTMKKK